MSLSYSKMLRSLQTLKNSTSTLSCLLVPAAVMTKGTFIREINITLRSVNGVISLHYHSFPLFFLVYILTCVRRPLSRTCPRLSHRCSRSPYTHTHNLNTIHHEWSDVITLPTFPCVVDRVLFSITVWIFMNVITPLKAIFCNFFATAISSILCFCHLFPHIYLFITAIPNSHHDVQ